jgi:hypothetical protein
MRLFPTPAGVAYFGAVKFAGYTLAAHLLRRYYDRPRAGRVGFGAVRTLIGIAVGVPTALSLRQIGIADSALGFYVLLAPVRFAEWLFVLWLFFERPGFPKPRSLKFAALGSVWSYVLDIPAALSVYFIPDGAWIC